MVTYVDESGISSYVLMICSIFAYGVLCQIINVFGIVTNVINIICYCKQGFKDSVNISLLGLAVSDLGSLIAAAWTCIGVPLAFVTIDLPFEPLEVSYLTLGMAHTSFTRVSSCITAMVALERCLCICAPLKIKSIITPKRATIITICIFILFFWSAAPVCAVNRLGLKFSPFRNRTVVGLISTADREEVERISFTINNFCIPFSAFFIIVICTIILSVKLYSKAQWRKNATSNTQVDTVSSRNVKTAKMVVTISILFIVCFIPVCGYMLAMAFLPELSVNGKYMSATLIAISIGYILESINSSTNILIYYYMSSKYRDTFITLCCNHKAERNPKYKQDSEMCILKKLYNQPQ